MGIIIGIIFCFALTVVLLAYYAVIFGFFIIAAMVIGLFYLLLSGLEAAARGDYSLLITTIIFGGIAFLIGRAIYHRNIH